MRTLTFLPGSSAYDLLHQATLFAQMQLSPQQYRLVAKLQDRLESIGVPKNPEQDRKPGAPIVYHCPEGGGVTFEEAEFSMLRQMLEHTQFLPTHAREVAGVYDLLDGTKEEKPTPKKATEKADADPVEG